MGWIVCGDTECGEDVINKTTGQGSAKWLDPAHHAERGENPRGSNSVLRGGRFWETIVLAFPFLARTAAVGTYN